MKTTLKLTPKQSAWLRAHLTVAAKMGPYYEDRQMAERILKNLEYSIPN